MLVYFIAGAVIAGVATYVERKRLTTAFVEMFGELPIDLQEKVLESWKDKYEES